ncbi:MAG: DsbE family thiol:disulfide interchange protein [Pseudomonadota bacterium]|nr:DsbE family thiol:disulfide interchange protein [Pseudomonadota bacterium]
MKKFLIPIVIFAALGVLLAYGLHLNPRRIPSPLIGKPLPHFDLPVLQNPSRTLTNSDLLGHVVLINIWASWCVSCRDEHPLLVALSHQHVVPIIGVSYKDKPADALAELKVSGNPYQTDLLDANGQTAINWGVYGVPETFVIDRKGIIRYKQIGPITQKALQQKLLPLIHRLEG